MPFALVALSLVPAVTGSLRLGELFGGPAVMPAHPGIAASPLPVIVHIAAVIPYAVLGAFQFSARLRRRRPGWHRAAGRLLVALGLAVAASGLWMTLAYPRQPGTGPLLFAFRLLAGSGMAAGLVLGVVAIRRGDVPSHRAWMTRAYALALGAGTQVLTGAVAATFPGGVPVHDLAMGAAWVINLAVAEAAIRRGRAGSGRRRRHPANAARTP
ncbi:MAG: DUF2306 domain-containing protein [Propionibacteriaceae bacterium]|nr:DUF2306 domain-containing protein [Propionibacteriaceae bacterium]